jgi:hypothetical protein
VDPGFANFNDRSLVRLRLAASLLSRALKQAAPKAREIAGALSKTPKLPLKTPREEPDSA